MNDNKQDKHIGEELDLFIIADIMPYKANDGHSLYKGICKECGAERIGTYQGLKRPKRCQHVKLGGVIEVSPYFWQNNRLGNIFRSMKSRCYSVFDKSYKWYGAKGIKICDEWLNVPGSFEKWALENGYNDTLTIHRVDENKDYCPENCQWVTLEYNSKYKSTTLSICANGEVHSGREWANILGFGANVINKYVTRYGIENTAQFIEKYLKDPNKKRATNQSYYDLYIGQQDLEQTL